MTISNDHDTPDDRTITGPTDPPDRGGPPTDTPDKRDPTTPPTEPRRITIQIDREEYPVPRTLLTNGELTGAQIRRLADPDIGPDRDLFEIVPGGSDRKIEDDEGVKIRDGMRFFSAPARINPGDCLRLRDLAPARRTLRPRHEITRDFDATA